MVTAAIIIVIILVSGTARLFVNRRYDVEEDKQHLVNAVRRNTEARKRNAELSTKH